MIKYKCPVCQEIHDYLGSQTTYPTTTKHGKRFRISDDMIYTPPPTTSQLQTILNGDTFKHKWDPSNLSILRTFYYFLCGKNHRGPKDELIELIIMELRKL